MADYTYPANDYDRVTNLLSLLGSHWYNSYQGQGIVQGYLRGRAQEEAQAHLDILETVASISRYEVPIFHKDNWYLLTLKETDLTEQPLHYGDGAVYGYQDSGLLYQYGTAAPVPGNVFEFSLPDELQDCNQIFNRITAPSRSLTKGIDFVIEDNPSNTGKVLRLRNNPFTDSRFPKRDIYEGSTVVDQELDLWVFRGDFDWDHVYTQFGYVLGLRLNSSEGFRDLVNAIMDGFVGGTAQQQVIAAVSAITGVPVVADANEEVELIVTDSSHKVIVTDKNVYKFPSDSTEVVAVGDAVKAGDQLVDTVTFYEFNGGTVPAGLGALTIGLGFLPGDYIDGLTFNDTDVPLTVTSDSNGITRVEFELGGFPTDVSAFWDHVHEQGISRGLTLARMLDTRGTAAVTEPTAASLPSTINPLEFLVENVLRFHTFALKIKASYTNSEVGLNNFRLLRKLTPPWTAMIILLELIADPESITPTSAGTTSAAGASETMESFSATEPVSESISVSNISEAVQLRRVDGVCQ